jgi:hypothetical protein
MLRYETLIAADELMRERRQILQRQAMIHHLLITRSPQTNEQPGSWRRLLPRIQKAMVTSEARLVGGGWT